MSSEEKIEEGPQKCMDDAWCRAFNIGTSRKVKGKCLVVYTQNASETTVVEAANTDVYMKKSDFVPTSDLQCMVQSKPQCVERCQSNFKCMSYSVKPMQQNSSTECCLFSAGSADEYENEALHTCNSSVNLARFGKVTMSSVDGPAADYGGQLVIDGNRLALQAPGHTCRTREEYSNFV